MDDLCERVNNLESEAERWMSTLGALLIVPENHQDNNITCE